MTDLNKIRILGMLFALSLLAGWIYISGPVKILGTVLSADATFILYGVLSYFVLLFVRTFRWWYILRDSGVDVNFKDTIVPILVGNFISNITPGKVGDPARSLFLKRNTGIPMTDSISSIVIERISDIFSLMVFSFAGILFLTNSIPSEWIAPFYGVMGIYLFGIGFIFYVMLKKSRIDKITTLIPIPKIRKIIISQSYNISSTFHKLIKSKKSIIYIVLSFIVWLLEISILYLSFLSIGVEIPVLVIIPIWSMSILVGTISSLPGGLGSTEVMASAAFVSILSLSIESVSSAVLLTRLFWLMFTIIPGIIAMRFLK